MSWIGNIIKSIFNNEGIGDNSQKPEEKHISEKKVNLKSKGHMFQICRVELFIKKYP